MLGFGRWLVFSETVTDSCLGTAYSTANLLPNIVFEVVAGGALASAVVPLLGAQLARGDRESVRRTASALLTWSVLVLTPIALLGMAIAGPLMSALIGSPGGCDGSSAGDVATRMFVFFAPQIPLYGIAVVLRRDPQRPPPVPRSGRWRRWCPPLVVISAYLAFGVGYDGSRNDLTAFPRRLGACCWPREPRPASSRWRSPRLVPVARLRLALRPTLGFPPGVARQARRLAIAGLAGLVAQQISVLVVIVLANREGGAPERLPVRLGRLPPAVRRAGRADRDQRLHRALGADAAATTTPLSPRTTAATTRAVVLVSLVGAALLAGTAEPVARMFLAGDGAAPPAPWQLGWALAAFAPGLVGYGLIAHLGRVLYAAHARPGGSRGDRAAGSWWSLAAVILLVALVPAERTVPAMGAANTIGHAGRPAPAARRPGPPYRRRQPRRRGPGGRRWRRRVPCSAPARRPVPRRRRSSTASSPTACSRRSRGARRRGVRGGWCWLLDGTSTLRALISAQVTPMADPPPAAVLLVLGTSGGGVGRHVASLAAGLVGAGHDVLVVGPAATEERFGFAAAGATFRAGRGRRPARGRPTPRRGPALRRLLRGADVVHAHGLRAGGLAVLALRAALARAVPRSW